MQDIRTTGRTRYRLARRWWWQSDVLVLQIEEEGWDEEMCGPMISCAWKRRWRDATLNDMAMSPKVVQ